MILSVGAFYFAWKIVIAILVAIVGLFVTSFIGMFGPGADPNTGRGSRSWIIPAVITAGIIAAIFLCS